MQNQTAYLVDEKKFELKDSEMPVAAADEVVVKIKHLGVCGSDVHFFNTPFNLGYEMTLPIVLGHEAAGEVISAGSGVTALKPGDLVALEPGIPCEKCEHCLSGKYNLCREVIFLAAPPFQTGALSRYIKHPARWCYKLPDGMDTLEGALVEPLSVGMYAVKRSGATVGNSVLIIGSGCIGLMTAEVCKAMGLKHIVVADLSEIRLKKASEIGASAVINTSSSDLIEEVNRMTDSKGFDIVFETAGSKVTAALTCDAVKAGGKIVMVGNIFGTTPFEFIKLNEKEADIISVFRYRNIYPTAIETSSMGLTPTKKVVTNYFKFEEVQKAFECALYEKETAVKVVIEME